MVKKLRQILSCPEWWLIIIPICAYWQVAFFSNTMQWDMTDQAFPWHRFISECFHQHMLPLWCPYSRLGYPFFADPQSGLFYPVTWVLTYFFHYSLYTNNLEFILHVMGAAFGMRFLLRSLNISRFAACIFGLVYALSGPFVSNANHFAFIYSLCWLPFILGSYIRLLTQGGYRFSLLMAIFLYLQLSGGYIGISIILFYVLAFIFLYYFLFIFSLGPRRLSGLLISHILLIALTAIFSFCYLYTVLQGLPYIDRQHGVSREIANSIAFTPPSFLTLLIPGLAASNFIPFGTDITMRGMYIGLLPLLLVFISLFCRGRFRPIVFLGSIFFLSAAAGAYTPVRGCLYDYIPFMDLFRMAAIFRFFSCVGFIVLAAYAFDDIFCRRKDLPVKAVKIIVVASGLLLMLFLVITFFTQRHLLQSPTASSLFMFSEYLRQTGILSVVFLQATIDIMILGLAFFSLRHISGNAPYGKYLFGGMVLLDMCLALQSNIFSTIVSTESVAKIQTAINKLPKGFPIAANVPLISYNEWNDSTLAPPIWHSAGFLRKQVTFDGNNSYNLTAYNKLADGKNFYKILSGRKLISLYPDASASIVCFNPNQISLTINSPVDVTVYIGQMLYPGWKVKVDGNQGPYAVAEDSIHLMKCDIPHGQHLVEIYFEPAGAKFSFSYTVVVFSIGIVCTAVLFARRLIL